MSQFPPCCRYVIGLMSVWLTLSAGSAAAVETVTLQLKWTHAFQFAGYYAAKEQGYYREAGLEVNIQEASPTTDPVRSVLDGEAEFGVGTSSLILERKAGKPVVVLAVVFQQSPYEIYAAPGINHLEDLIGKRLMLEPQADELLAYLKKAGIPLDRIQILPHSFDADGLMQGKADAISGYISNEPYYFKLARYPYQTFSPRSAGIDFYGDNLFTTEQQLRDHPERVRAFRAATMRGWKYAKDHRDEVIELIRARYSQKHSHDYLRYESDQMIPLLQPNLIEIGYMNPARWRHIADTYAVIGLLPANYSLDGFIYNADKPDLGWFYRSLAGALLLILSISAVALYIFRQNRQQMRIMEQNRVAGEALEQANKDLAEREALLKQIMDTSTAAIFLVDNGGRITHANQRMTMMFGWPVEGLLGREYAELVNPAERDSVRQKTRELLASQAASVDLERRYRRADGSEFWGHLACDRFHDTNGREYGIVAMIADISERKQGEENLNRKNAEIEQFIYTVSHDLRSPLVTIRTFLGYLGQDIANGDNEHIARDLEYLSAAADRMEVQLNELLDMSRIGQAVHTREVAGFRELAAHALDALAGQINTAGGDIRVSGEDVPLCGDRRRLLQIWQNLLDNALKYMGGHTAPDILIGVEQQSGQTVFFIRDNGIGIAPEYHEKIFGIFEQLDRQAGGVGMGLALVKRIVESYGGWIRVESDGTATGSCFRFTLPGALNTVDSKTDDMKRISHGS
ncbi:MAG: ABC transporter substrate-binding protein [Geobacteraceae bacterium]|nr:ABC transporter substrate-binding protein [Geobacteraceae bacterium]